MAWRELEKLGEDDMEEKNKLRVDLVPGCQHGTRYGYASTSSSSSSTKASFLPMRSYAGRTYESIY